MRQTYDLDPLHNDIINHSWAWHGYCNCVLIATVYRKREYKLKHFFTQGTWELKQRAKVIQTGTNETLIEKINSI